MILTPFAFLLATLAIYRLVRLWLYDQITSSLHNGVMRRVTARNTPFRRWLADLLTCQFCLGVWIGFAASTAAAAFAYSGFTARLVAEWFTTGLALAAAQSFLHLLEDRLSVDDD